MMSNPDDPRTSTDTESAHPDDERGGARSTAILPQPPNLPTPAPASAVIGVTEPGAGLPTWFTTNRVHGHTRLRLGPWHDQAEFTEAGAGFKALGAAVFTRHVKSGDEDPWWPTALPLWDDGRPWSDRDREIDGVLVERGRSIAKEVIDEAHAQGLHVIAYVWHMAEARLAARHPDWICRRPSRDGTPGPPIVGKRGVHLDITGPYREVVLTRLLELADMGVDGLKFDERHLPPEGCWGSALETAWVAETGQPAPTDIDDADPRYRRFIDFKARRIEETFAYWRDTVKATHPHVVFLTSTTTLPALTDREMTTRLASIADSAKNEYRLAVRDALNKRVFIDNPDLAVPAEHLRQALGWTVLRDSSDGRPPHIWVSGVPNIHHARAAAASVITFGGVANMDVQERTLLGRAQPSDGKTPLDALQAAFALGARVSPHIAGTRPLRWAAVHFSERNRNARRADYRGAWQQVLWPLIGAYKVLTELGLPVGVVNDHQLADGELDGYGLLVLPNAGELTTSQRQAVAAFEAGGGTIIENKPAWGWSDPNTTESAARALRATIQPHTATAPLVVTGGPAGRYAVAYMDRRRLVVAVTNDFSWVQITSADNPVPVVNAPAPPAAGVRVAWRARHDLPHPRPTAGDPFRLRAFDAVSDTALPIHRSGDNYSVFLPPFHFMALVVVTGQPAQDTEQQ
jgi:hypothetical protein